MKRIRVEGLVEQRSGEQSRALATAPIHDDARAALTDLAVTAGHRPA